MKAIWNGTVIAESDETIVVEGNHYFPPSSVRDEYFSDIDNTTVCAWKGTANYYAIDVDGERNEGGAWVYREPKPEAEEIRDYVAFWQGVEVVE